MKKFLSVLLAASVCASGFAGFAGCGGGDEEPLASM